MVKHKSNRNKYLLITVLLLIVIVTVTAVAVMRTDSKKPSASEYFIVTSAHANEGTFPHYPNGTRDFKDNSTVLLTFLDLNVTAIGGDAHNVYVRCSSQANPVDDTVKVLTNGTSAKAGAWPIQLVGGDNNFHGIILDLNDNGTFEVDIQIACDEATLATIPVFISPKDIFNVPGGIVS